MLCTANQCRSPMAEALLQRRLDAAGIDARVTSAGELPGGVHASPGSVRAMQARGFDLAEHRSRTVTPEMVDAADLVIGMARRHVRNAVVLAPHTFPRTFTLRELVRRATAIGPRRADQPLGEWLAVLHRGRTARELLAEDPRDDVADPIGGPDSLYEETASELTELVDRAVDLAFVHATRRESA